jgi:hypothetical protein
MDAGAAESVDVVFLEIEKIRERGGVDTAIFFNYLQFEFRPITDFIELEGKVSRARTCSSY